MIGHHSVRVDGKPKPLRRDKEHSWRTFDFMATEEDISGGFEWSIPENRHAIIVHGGGAMSELETELDGEARRPK